MDGKPWPIANDTTVWLPGGVHTVEVAPALVGRRVLDFNGEALSAGLTGGELLLTYSSASRAIAILESRPVGIEMDGVGAAAEVLASGANWALLLPRGKHTVRIR